MSANVLGLLGTIVIPSVVICLVCVITFVNLYLNIRRRFPAKVNCWFCNTDARVPYDESNSFVCTACRQYNGFSADGDYNREIPEQYQQRLNNYCYHQPANVTDDDKWGSSARSMAGSSSVGTPHNGLCFGCNRNQELKIHQLASFVPENEDNYDAEVEEYRNQLEQAYKLCGRCERVLRRTLNDVKRNILGSKLAQIGGKSLKVLDMHIRASTKHFAQLKRQRWAKVCVYAISGLLLMKLYQELTEAGWTVADLMLLCPPSLLTGITVVVSYALAMKQLVWQQYEKLLSEPTVQQTTERVETLGNELLERYAPQLLQSSAHLFESFSSQVPSERNTPLLLNGAVMALAALLASLGSQRTAIKQVLILALCTADSVLQYTDYQDSYNCVFVLITLAALVLAFSCIGQRVVRSEVAGGDMNSSFHKIYSQQCSESDYSDADTTANAGEQQSQSPAALKQQNFSSRFSTADSVHPNKHAFIEPQFASYDADANLSKKSLDTTKSVSPSTSSMSPTNSFFMNSYTGNHSSKVSGSLFNVAEAAQPAESGSMFRQEESCPAPGSLLKTPSFSVDDFHAQSNHHRGRWNHLKRGPASIASGRSNQFRYSMSTITQEADPFREGAQDPPLIEDDIDRLSISGRMSLNTSLRGGPGSRESLGSGNPFAHIKPSKGELDRDEFSRASLRQRRLVVRPAQEPFSAARESSLWPGMLATGGLVVVPVSVSDQQAHMSRTSSQSSGFESQLGTTRRNTPTEPDVLSVYTPPEVAQLETSNAPPSPVPSSASVLHQQGQSGNLNSSSPPHSLFGEQNLFNSALQQHHPVKGSSGLFFPKFNPYATANSGFASTASNVSRHIFPPQQSQTPSSYHHNHHHQQQQQQSHHNLAGIGRGSSLSLNSSAAVGLPFGTSAFAGRYVVASERLSNHAPSTVGGTSFYTSNRSTATGRASLLNLSKLVNEPINGTSPLPTA